MRVPPRWLAPRLAPSEAACTSSRRQAIAAALLLLRPLGAPPPAHAEAACDASQADAPGSAFRSAAFEKPNYSSAIVASRDTNVSPREAYDIIAERALLPKGVPCARALDLGAGAGVSTQLLWLNGFRSIKVRVRVRARARATATATATARARARARAS